MSPIMKSGRCAVLVFGFMLLAAGCGDPTSAVFDPDRGRHKTAWLPGEHSLAVTMGASSAGTPVYSTEPCTECHGADLSGGISGVSCTSCHLGGPTAVHPLTWDPIYLTHGPSVSTGADGTTLCANQYCHGTTLTGIANSGPSCSSCHSMPFDPATVICGACHSIPPDGTKFPDLAGKHRKHATSLTTSCDICHSGASGYRGDHHNGVVNFSFLAAYTPKTGGSPSYNAGTNRCSNMSCHGAQQTPSWFTGVIDVNTQCAACHAYGTAQYNSFSSGEHDKHVNGEGFACTECHDTANLAGVHFNDLNTIVMNEAYLTIRNALHYTGTAGTAGNCTISCHGKNHNPERW